MEQPTKACETCGARYSKHPSISTTQWKAQRFCSLACKGQFVKPFLGRTHSVAVRKRLSESKRGKKNPMYGKTPSRKNAIARVAAVKVKLSGPGHYRWKGDRASYFTIHRWLNRRYPRKRICEHCGKKTPWTQYAKLKGRRHSHNRAFYAELCVRCHNAYDGRRRDKLGQYAPAIRR